MPRVLVGIIFLFIVQSAGAQSIGSTSLTEEFAASVQTIDDFFDRFNGDPKAPYFQYMRARYPEKSITRKTAVVSLFEARHTTWSEADVTRFVNRFGMNYAPKLRFAQNNWYAVLHCKVSYLKKRRNLDLVLKAESVIARDGTIGYKWSLFSAKAAFLSTINDSLEREDSAIVSIIPVMDSLHFLHPMSHAINFMNVHDIFHKYTLKDYFARQAERPPLDTLQKLVDAGQLRFIQVDSVQYHLLQLPGWIVQVGYFERQDTNSGWLIQGLMPADESEKKRYLKSQLNIP